MLRLVSAKVPLPAPSDVSGSPKWSEDLILANALIVIRAHLVQSSCKKVVSGLISRLDIGMVYNVDQVNAHPGLKLLGNN